MLFHDLESLKTAADDQIEGAFFQLAYQRLQDKLKNLIPFLIGFEIVEKSEDNTKALGMFGFRSSSGQVLYVPAFFANGKVKPLDLLYSKNNEQFYPLNEDFAEMFIKDEMLGLGGSAKEDRSAILRDSIQGDYRQLAVPPRTGKYSIASVIDYVKNSENPTKQAFATMLEKDAEFCEAVMRFYPLEKIAEAITPADGDKYRKGKGAAKKVKLIKPEDKPALKDLTDSQKSTMLTQGYVIVDDRKPDEKSKFGVIESTLNFANPDENGFYQYLTRSGGLRYGLVIVRPKQLQQHFGTDDTIVVDIGSKNGSAYLKDSKQVFVKEQIKVQDYSEVHKIMVPASEGKPGFADTYILINENLKATQPFRIISNFSDASGIRRLIVDPHSVYEDYQGNKGPLDRPGSAHGLPRGNYNEHPKKSREIVLVMTKRTASDRLEYKDDMVYVPAGFKLLKVSFNEGMSCCPLMSFNPSKKEKEEYEAAEKERKKEVEERQRAEPGTLGVLNGVLSSKNIFPMSVHTNGSDFYIDINGAKKRYDDPLSAKIAMVFQVGLDEKSAEELLAGLTPGFSKKGHVKLATTGEMYPTPLEETPYANEFGQPTTSGIGMESMLPAHDTYTGNPTQRDLGTRSESGDAGIDPKYVQQAIQLASSGQKEIFDTHTIGALAKYVSVGDKITEYLPSMVEAMDRLGRILFLLHWDTDKFKEMYGRGDLPELVELLTSVLKNMGDLIIFLKRRSPELSINMSKDDSLAM